MFHLCARVATVPVALQPKTVTKVFTRSDFTTPGRATTHSAVRFPQSRRLLISNSKASPAASDLMASSSGSIRLQRYLGRRHTPRNRARLLPSRLPQSKSSAGGTSLLAGRPGRQARNETYNSGTRIPEGRAGVSPFPGVPLSLSLVPRGLRRSHSHPRRTRPRLMRVRGRRLKGRQEQRCGLPGRPAASSSLSQGLFLSF